MTKNSFLSGAARVLCCWLIALVVGTCAHYARAEDGGASLSRVIRATQPKVVKLYGAGGLRGLEAFQSGIMISGEGHVLTVWSYVLDADTVTVVLDDGRRFEAEHLGADPLTEIAVLKFDPQGETLSFFDLSAPTTADVGERVLALSNLFGVATGNEPVSVLQGVVSAIAPLEARRGAFATPFRGEVYIVDAAANNPGAAGGALTDAQGRLLGMLGKELRSSLTGTWLNYALPTAAFAETAQQIIDGKFTPPDLTELDRPDDPMSLGAMGIVLVPNVVTRTPPYIDRVVPDSAAARVGLQRDDLLMMVEGFPASSCADAAEIVARYERGTPIQIAVLRGDAFLTFSLSDEPGDVESGDGESSPATAEENSSP